jgi:two-component system sensor histidine kinase TctE
VAAFALSLKGTSASGAVLVQVGETLARRSALAGRAALAIVIPMLLMTLTAAAAIAYGVGQGLEPVRRLRDRLAARPALDPSPVPLEGTPAELRPFLDEINSLLQCLSEAVEAQSRFVSDAVHQLRTPIAGIRAQAEAAMAAARHDDKQLALQRIAHSAQNMGELVRKLLILARVDAAENTLRLVRLDGIALAREIARDWAPQALAKAVEISFETAGGEAQVMGDAQLLREMLANLIDNALRYGGTRITLTVDSLGREGVAWSLSDNGPGIPEPRYAAVFVPFHRLSDGVDGAGLGLTIVQRIARLHGAEVSLGPSKMGSGLTVSVKFPPIFSENQT